MDEDIKLPLNRKRAILARDHKELRAVQKDLKRKLREAKNKYGEDGCQNVTEQYKRGVEWDEMDDRLQQACLWSSGGPRICY